MKRLSFLLCLLALVVVVSGCCLDEQVKTKTHENRVAMEAFIKFIDEGHICIIFTGKRIPEKFREFSNHRFSIIFIFID